jgi:hypothetical protein
VVPSVVSDALLRVLTKAKDEHEATLLEKAVKDASATGCMGSYLSCACLTYILFSLCL